MSPAWSVINGPIDSLASNPQVIDLISLI
jgi:hypothetical protein